MTSRASTIARLHFLWSQVSRPWDAMWDEEYGLDADGARIYRVMNYNVKRDSWRPGRVFRPWRWVKGQSFEGHLLMIFAISLPVGYFLGNLLYDMLGAGR